MMDEGFNLKKTNISDTGQTGYLSNVKVVNEDLDH